MTVRDWLKDYEFWPLVEKYAMEQSNGETLEFVGINAAEALLGAFNFLDTNEGHGFWWNIYQNLPTMTNLQRNPQGEFKTFNDEGKIVPVPLLDAADFIVQPNVRVHRFDGDGYELGYVHWTIIEE